MVEIIISVIIPIYNSENLLSKCLDSIINQTLNNIEIICVDDGSTDNSFKILKEYENKDNRVIVITQENSGAGIARNKGIDIAKGKYIAFVDSDDWIKYDALKKLHDNIKNNDSDMVLFNAIEHKPNNQHRERIYFSIDETVDYNDFTFDYKYNKNLVMNKMFVIWSKLYKTSFLKENNIKFNNHEVFNDVQFHIKTMLLAKKISYLPEILYNYRRLGQNSLQTSKANTHKGFILFDIFDEIEAWLKENGFFEELELNYYGFILNESQGRLKKSNDELKEDLFKIVKEKFLKLSLSTEILQKLKLGNYRFYIHIINSDTYSEFIQIYDSDFGEIKDFNLKLPKNIIKEKNKQIDNLTQILNESFNNTLLTAKIIERIKKFNLFDEEFYENNYDCEGISNPLLHYVYIGHKKGNKPNNQFDGEFYSKIYPNVAKSGIDPFFYFVLYGIEEGSYRVNKNIRKLYSINKLNLTPKIKKFNALGVDNNKSRFPRLIVSLTSFPERLQDIHFSLYSILTQKLKPDKVILWLAKSQFPNYEKNLPQTLLSLKENGLLIKWCDDWGPYKKLLPALKLYPNDIIVTADDDIFYSNDWLKKLYDNHIKYPNTIIAHRAKRVSFNNGKILEKYNKWPFSDDSEPSFLNFCTNGGGTLFPPNSLSKLVLDYNLARKLCGNSDDIWIWGMAILNNTKIKVIEGNMPKINCVNPAREVGLLNQTTLWSTNSKGSNDIHLKNLINKFPKILDNLFDEYSNNF